MKNQGQMNKAAHLTTEQVEARMLALLRKVQTAFSASPQIQVALGSSQTAFEAYRSKQLDLISVTSDGTTAPLLRDTTFCQLTEQREITLQRFLIDSKPDAA